ncbi:MAG: MFS transporter [Bacteroidetes bacterium]|nr:MFS transporter [Bacteroidota bacterium]
MSLLKAESLQIFQIKEFRLFVMARFFLTLSIQMQFATIALQVYHEYSNKSEFMLGMIGLTEAVPAIITALYSGYISDHYPRKRILVLGIMALLIAAVFLYFNSEPMFAWFKDFGVFALFTVVFLFGIIRAFLGACMHPFMSQLVPRNFYTHSATWNSTAWHVGAILGPVAAGIIYGFNNGYHANWCHLTEVFLFALALFFILLIRHKGAPGNTGPKEPIMQSMRMGLKFVFTHKLILSALSLDLFAVLLGGAVAMLPSFTDKVLHLGPQAYGWLRTAPAIGAVFMALIMAVWPPSKRAGKAMLWSVAAFGVFTILFALSTTFWMAFIMLFLTGAFDNVSVVVRHSILQLSTPDNMRGRVSAINNIFIGSSNEIGAFESGTTAKLFGLVPSIVLGGFLTLGIVATIGKRNKELNDLDLSRLQ